MALRPANEGFTLLEVMIATMLLVVALVGSIALVLGLRRVNQSTRDRDVAYFLAQQALDQLDAIPLSLAGLTTSLPATSLPTNNDAPLLGTPVIPTTLSCYPIGNDVIADRPIACASPMPSAYFVRTWSCCGNTTAVVSQGGASQTALALPTGSCGLTAPVVGSPDTSSGNGAVCYVQVEVTWPTENPLAPATPLNGSPQSLFVDTASTTAQTLGLSFSNHVYLSEVRAN